MRPVRRGASPFQNKLSNYKDAKTDLISRISKGEYKGIHVASYCSYCERPIKQNLAVEHIQPKKGKYAKPELEVSWSNFLLSCVNCNSTKGSRGVFFDYLFFPDRDNTFNAFVYSPDGRVIANPNNGVAVQNVAKNTLWLTGLDKDSDETLDINGNLIALDRVSQRMEVWGIAEMHLDMYIRNADNNDIKDAIVFMMLSSGYFSIWMTIFSEYPEMTTKFIDSISGTRESGCFDGGNNNSPKRHNNADNLPISKFKQSCDKV
ncbi:HNH endonuclease [Vibrio metschnikovii]|uniref:HNH endonuclease n=1 Tax=Vibrio metschnikovii TaxID=28172 RepID=UPI001C30DEDB|nr:HNH endonuclease [Vibrio metschnikovii]